jgi:hypothetical protein
MKYFTRELYRSLQGKTPGSTEMRRVRKLWATARVNYHKHLQAIRPQLPDGARELSKHSFHDAVVKSFTRTRKNLVIVLDGRRELLADNIRLVFKGVKSVKGLDNMVDDQWLYEEVHLSRRGKFEYCILLRRSQIAITADDVDLIESGMRADEKAKLHDEGTN